MSVSLYPLRHVRHFGTSDKTQRLSSTTRIIRRGHGFLQRCDELWLRKYREKKVARGISTPFFFQPLFNLTASPWGCSFYRPTPACRTHRTWRGRRSSTGSKEDLFCGSDRKGEDHFLHSRLRSVQLL